MKRPHVNTPSGLRRRAGTARGGSGFTLLEMIVAVGAVGLIAIGLARLFSSTGETVRKGRSISRLNDAAAIIERQLAADIAIMTREGPLVIRNKWATVAPDPSPVDVPLAPDLAATARARRVDSMVFFTRGHFTSARYPLGDRAPSATTARVYVGHGARRTPAQAANVTIEDNPVDPTFAAAWPSELGAPGPNQYASDWTLLRNVVLLAPPRPQLGASPTTSDDGRVQIALQPAAASVFGSDMEGGGYATGKGQPAVVSIWGGWRRATPAAGAWPQLSSGIVDVAAIDIGTVRARVLGGTVTTRMGAVHPSFQAPAFRGSLPPIPMDSSNAANSDINKVTQFGASGGARIRMPTCKTTELIDADSAGYRTQRVMADLFPGYDAQFFGDNPDAGGTNGKLGAQGRKDLRLPCAAAPPDYTGAAGSGVPFTEPELADDQMMLSASNLAGGVTEFIIEWSFGDVYPPNPASPTDARTGKLIWHGMERYEDLTGTAPELVCAPYTANVDWNINQGRRYGQDAVVSSGRLVPAGLLHWPVDIGRTGSLVPASPGAPVSNNDLPKLPVYSFFGYYDPSARTSPPTAWPWPKLLRVTMSLTDPADPTVEQRYQFIFRVPDADTAD